MNLEDIPFAIVVVSQQSFTGPYVGVIVGHGQEVWRTRDAYETSIEAHAAAFEYYLKTAEEVLKRESARN